MESTSQAMSHGTAPKMNNHFCKPLPTVNENCHVPEDVPDCDKNNDKGERNISAELQVKSFRK